ncbi:ornithine cyclodeaminase family protein [Vogesella sp. GCM10023246]|uniref:Ornithine cyclodeaminase family protein n=1 Tax=Vogesella oryzagri TaxID=3160864 RepID=A0ABV1M048_9NEIS
MTTSHHRPPVILSAAQIRPLLAQLPLAATLRRLFAALADEQAVQPAQSLTLFPHGAGDFITYQGVLASEQVFGAKLSPYIVTSGRPVITAWTTLMSMQTGQPLLFCDSGELTAERTAGTTALAVDELAPADSRVLVLIGCGALGQAHLRHALPLRDWREVRVYAPDLAANPALQQTLAAVDARVRCCDSMAAATDGADVIMLCTSSASAVLDPASLAKPALITSISTNAVNAHEVPPESLAAMEVYCDHAATTPTRAGEMVLAAERGCWQPQALRGDLAALVSGRAPRPDYHRHVFFRSIGMGLQDVAIAHAVWQLHSATCPA